MRVLTGTEMNEVERRAVEASGVTLCELMERAGAAVARAASRTIRTGPVVIISGKGNNGGDGIVAARLLAEKGIACHLFLLAGEDELTPESAAALAKLKAAEGARAAVALTQQDHLPNLREVLPEATLVIDCIFGFGLHGAVRGLAGEVIETVNASGKPVLSVDIPSGVEADTGRVDGPAIKAVRTITFTAPKMGLVLAPGARLAGVTDVADIGIARELVESAGATEVHDTASVAAMLPQRSFDAHKKSCGRVLVVAGSVGMTGAAALCAQSALRAGAGTVLLAVATSLNDIFEQKLTEVMTVPMPETASRSLSVDAADKILELCDSFDVLALGPGLSLDESTAALARELVRNAGPPLVLDADGLNAVAGEARVLEERRSPTIITPHSGELARLAGTSADEIQADRLGAAKGAARRWGVVTVLKGAGTITSDGDRCAINTTGNAGLATAGTGDVLTGIIASLIAQGADAYDAAVAGVYVHGLAGDLAAAKLTGRCVVASDVLSFLPKAFGRLQPKTKPN